MTFLSFHVQFAPRTRIVNDKGPSIYLHRPLRTVVGYRLDHLPRLRHDLLGLHNHILYIFHRLLQHSSITCGHQTLYGFIGYDPLGLFRQGLDVPVPTEYVVHGLVHAFADDYLLNARHCVLL